MAISFSAGSSDRRYQFNNLVTPLKATAHGFPLIWVCHWLQLDFLFQ